MERWILAIPRRQYRKRNTLTLRCTGVTTNPTILKRDGVRCNVESLSNLAEKVRCACFVDGRAGCRMRRCDGTVRTCKGTLLVHEWWVLMDAAQVVAGAGRPYLAMCVL